MLLRVVEWLDGVLSASQARAGRVCDRAVMLAERLRVQLPVYSSVHSGLGRLNSYAGVATPVVFKGDEGWSRRILTARAPIHPALRNFVSDLHATLLRVFAYGCAVAAVGLLLIELFTASVDCVGLLAAGSEPKTIAQFAERIHSACGPRDVTLAATPQRGAWIEAAPDPKLRGRQ